jgi:hypothetical protein
MAHRQGLIRHREIRQHVNALGYRLSAESYSALNEVVKRAIEHAIFYTRPAKTIRAGDVLRVLASHPITRRKPDNGG